MGRHKIEHPVSKKAVTVRLKDADWKALRKLAAMDDIPMGQVLRQLIRAAAVKAGSIHAPGA